MELPVYLITGFLEAGKTSFIQETLAGAGLERKGNTLLLVCEEGIEEYDPAAFGAPDVYCEVIENECDITPARLASLAEKHDAELVMVEYNGMWQVDSLYRNLPEGWFVYQELFLCDSRSIENYNKNMRSLVVDKLTSSDLVAFNRVTEEADRMPLHLHYRRQEGEDRRIHVRRMRSLQPDVQVRCDLRGRSTLGDLFGKRCPQAPSKTFILL